MLMWKYQGCAQGVPYLVVASCIELIFDLFFVENFESTGPVEQLLSRWRSTFPHPKLDPISVWDDVVTNR